MTFRDFSDLIFSDSILSVHIDSRLLGSKQKAAGRHEFPQGAEGI